MQDSQVTGTVVMATPDQFRWDAETARTNRYMRQPEALDPPLAAADVPVRALSEFRGMVESVRNRGISVLVLHSPWESDTPAAVFLNNWFSHLQDAQLVIFPMLATHRRHERQAQALVGLLQADGIPSPE